MKEKSALSARRDQPPSVFWLAEFGMKGTALRPRQSSAHRLSTVPGLLAALYARYRNQSRSSRVQLNRGMAKEPLADDGTTERQSGQSPDQSEGEHDSFKEMSRT